MRLARLVALALCLLLAGCGTAGGEEGTASLWITRDRGATVLFEGEVPAGTTVMQALRREAEVETRYGGRFVQSIDGIEGSLDRGDDWFFFVNGVASDRSAAEYRLRDGEIAWWDYRPWQGADETRIVVGAFPEPFVHGFDGRRREVVVRYEEPGQKEGAEAIARLLEARAVERGGAGGAGAANVFVLAAGPPRFVAETPSADGPYRFVFAGDAEALARDPDRYRFRYEVR